jgi:hypothetical protein
MFNHYHLIRKRWLSVYLGGNFCAIEIDIRFFGKYHTFQFFTNNGFYNHF